MSQHCLYMSERALTLECYQATEGWRDRKLILIAIALKRHLTKLSIHRATLLHALSRHSREIVQILLWQAE